MRPLDIVTTFPPAAGYYVTATTLDLCNRSVFVADLTGAVGRAPTVFGESKAASRSVDEGAPRQDPPCVADGCFTSFALPLYQQSCTNVNGASRGPFNAFLSTRITPSLPADFGGCDSPLVTTTAWSLAELNSLSRYLVPNVIPYVDSPGTEVRLPAHVAFGASIL